MESAVGYSHWVLKTLIEGTDQQSEHFRYSIEKLEAVTVSCDVLGALIGELYTESHTVNTSVWSCLLFKLHIYWQTTPILNKTRQCC